MNHLRFIGAWLAYGAGHTVWLLFGELMDIFNNRGFGWQMFKLEQWLMALSTTIQGDTDYGPWKDVNVEG